MKLEIVNKVVDEGKKYLEEQKKTIRGNDD